ncbi:type II toxin-antitoxin system HicA family toxin [Neorhizobium lilium]|uniref:Type II toxin-antitoxin system HicA family toxin n=1 Tax=Neorhizobium lilium TaxID=2503024 RepID=A0A3S3S3W9_9HYPH|nr:type II toxin-antitoxin system HicA family toxin [Neorhizobium lilium]
MANEGLTSKRLERMRANPQADWRMEDIIAVCAEFEIACRAPRGGSSHFKVSHPAIRDILTVPSKRPIKPVYIRHLVQFIDAVRTA